MTKRINSPDTEADIMLRKCLDRTPRTSFVMIAGAGSGKTTSLVKALSHLVSTKSNELRRKGQQVACITYTEIAAKEIRNDVANSPLVHVSTIHSFLWTIGSPFQKDIKKWVIQRIAEKCLEIQEKINKPRTRTRDRLVLELDRLKSQLGIVESLHYFNYGTGSNYAKGILGHDDIIKLVTSLIEEHKMLKAIISQKYPYIFVDESQDTFPNIVSSLKLVDHIFGKDFCLGFFGDPMQKIFPTGIGEIAIENSWERITKPENFRCSQRVLKTVNAIRKPADGLEQTRGRFEIIEGKEFPVEGSSQIFILPINDFRTSNVKRVQQWSTHKFDDDSWLLDDKIKVLVVVHRMAAKRLGFPNLYSAMNDNSPSSFKDGLLDGTAWPLKPFMNFVLPLINLHSSNLNFEVLNILRAQSPKLTKNILKGDDLRISLAELKKGVDRLAEMMRSDSTATVLDVLKIIQEYEMTSLDERLLDHLNETNLVETDEDDDENLKATEISSMQNYFACPANEFLGYKKYCDNESPFATQQGIKGAEFDKVITILDDDEGTNNLFSYDKYFGISSLSDVDKKNIAEGKDNVISRTRRLFYVSCSRARKDLIVIYFTSNVPEALRLISETGIFQKESIFLEKDLASIIIADNL
ncbi:UvrD-helicase domain-containing protein [Arcicella sp. DC2W]|uniref:UvrD-helicase domain-containing protein n=1 Tax=Arcicella gelida TaxID=2984195 RepID=A0ABU5S0W4_9BACT|nr:UvrD-helicase domain-containing protein [Arcicella sp. DC2W]MEA5402117.1 UvrD-helicase domain-containing protein [Arcicella sp. DC2W]